jgi:uncharacterized membrane protein
MNNVILNIAGLSASIVGTVILAFSINSYLSAMKLKLQAHELTLLSILHPNRGPIIEVTGVDVHMKRGERISAVFTVIGVLLVIAGFICQLLPYALPYFQK